MGEPVDTSAEAVERAAVTLEALAYLRDGVPLHDSSATEGVWNRQAAAMLRALAKERAAAQQRISDLEAQCARVQRDADRWQFLRNQKGMPTPEEFDALVDADMAMLAEGKDL